MLVVLRAKNFVLMDALELRLEPGLNVLTGETGAGKSIIVGALSLVLGGRANAELVRPGAQEAEIEALFDVRGSERAAALLDAAGVPHEGEVVIRRVVQENGRSRAYVNGRLCTAGELQKLASELADVSSQHESVALTDPSTHVGYLDRFAQLLERRIAVNVEVSRLSEVAQKVQIVRERLKQRGEREAFLQFQMQAIEAVNPRPGELNELKTERGRLRHATKLLDVSQRAAARLEASDDSICDTLSRLVFEVTAAADLDATLQPIAHAIQGAWTELRDAGRELGRYAERLDADPGRLSEIEERLYRIEGLIRQHGPAIEDVLLAQKRLEEELVAFRTADERIGDLEAERLRLMQSAAGKARELSQMRRAGAEKLGQAISHELSELGMGGARVLVDVAPLEGGAAEMAVDGARLGPDGIDRVEFLISPNKGIDPRPLRRIASGGELSRALLALKRVLADSGPAGLYVFDEVDSGVGGAVADKIGRAIADVARHRQVLCITHLAPIAAYADAHFVVTKESVGAVAKSAVTRVEDKERMHEVARMIAGAKVTPAAVRAATELVRAARTAAD